MQRKRTNQTRQRGGAVTADQAGAVDGEHHRQVLQRHVVNQLVVGALQKVE